STATSRNFSPAPLGPPAEPFHLQHAARELYRTSYTHRTFTAAPDLPCTLRAGRLCSEPRHTDRPGPMGIATLRWSYPISYPSSPDGPLAVLTVREATGAPKPRLLDRVREAIRARHYSRRTEKACVAWIRR